MNDEPTTLTTTEPPQLLQMSKLADAKAWYNNFVHFTQEILKESLDYGVIPGVEKPALFKPGAEKLRFVYGLQTKTEKTSEKMDLTNNYLDFSYKTTVMAPNGKLLAECEGNANSFEPKFRYVWVREDELPEGMDKSKLRKRSNTISEFSFAIQKAETSGKYGKPKEHWDKFKNAIADGTAKRISKKTSKGGIMEAWEIGSVLYRIPNEDVVGLKNTMMKMAQKRSYVGAIMLATGASEFFTQDVEDMEIPIDETMPSRVTTLPQTAQEKPVAEDEVVESEEIKEETAVIDYMSKITNAVSKDELLEAEKAIIADKSLEPKKKFDFRKLVAEKRAELDKDIPF